jgi:hypothetical protein
LKLPRGRPSRFIKTVHLTVSNLSVFFGVTECIQIMDQKCKIYLDTKPPDGSKIKLLKIWTPKVIKFSSVQSTCIVVVPHRSDLMDFLPQETVDTITLYCEHMLKNKPEEFKELDYREAQGKRYLAFMEKEKYGE